MGKANKNRGKTSEKIDKSSDAQKALSPTRMPATTRKPQMPSPSAVGNARRGGLGRGLASLIPTGPARPSLGDGAADIVLGNRSTVGGVGSSRDSVKAVAESKNSVTSENLGGTSGIGTKRHSDVSDSDSKYSPATESAVGSAGHEPVNASTDSNVSRETNGADFGASYQEIPLKAIRTNAKQPREVFDEEALEELVHSIKEFGLMQPIVVRRAPNEESTFELIMGERRLRAAGRAGFEAIPAIVRETADDEMLRDALLENIHRVQLNPLEEAAAYQQLMEEFGVTQEQLAKKIGRSRPLITNMIRLLQLPVSVQRRVGAGVLSAGHARALLGLKLGADTQEKLAQRIVSEGLSVRATEEAVTLLNRGEEASAAARTPKRGSNPLSDEVNTWVDKVSDALDTKVTVQMGKKKGKIVVEFGGPDDFDRIIELLKVKKK